MSTETELEQALRLLAEKETELQTVLKANQESAKHVERLDLLLNRKPTGDTLGQLVDKIDVMFMEIRQQMAALQMNLARLRQGQNAQRNPGELILPDRRH